MKFIKALTLSLFIGFASFAQAQYNIKFNVEGLQQGEKCILAHYYADQNKIVDTAAVDSKGNVVFKGDITLPNGVYIFVLPKKSYIEFIVPTNDQEFEIDFDTTLSPFKKVSRGSLDNQIFFDFDRFAIGPGQEKRDLVKEFRECEDEDCKNAIREKVRVLDVKVDDRRKEIVMEYPNTFTAKLFRAVLDVEIPEELKSDTTGLRYQWFVKHYWDNIDLTDDGMIRTPVFKGKLEYYITKLIPQQPDSLIPVIDDLCNRIEAGGAMELFKYVVWWNTNTSEESKTMCMDKVLHHMAKNYYCAGRSFWADSSLVAKMCEHANKIEPTLCGRVAPNMTLVDSTFARYYEMHKVPTPITIVVFWDHQCGHCKKELPKLKEMYDSMKHRGVEIYAVYTQADWKGWRKYIKENKLDWLNVMDISNEAPYRKEYNIISTPQVYFLDHNKVIQWKNPPAENAGKIVEVMLEQYEKAMGTE